MENKYTLTIYIAAPSTPMVKENGEQSISSVGHIYYAIDDGKNKMGWGFAPTVSSPVWKGKVVYKEYEVYQNPVLEKTMEITKEQYDLLKSFGQNPEKHGFNDKIYNAFSNSCVDFVYTALKEGKIYHKQVYGNDIIGLVDHEGAIRVPRNIEEIKNIPNPIPNSYLNKTIERPLPQQDWIQKNILSEVDISKPLHPHASDEELIDYGFAALLADDGEMRDRALESLMATDAAKQFERDGMQAALDYDREQEMLRPRGPVMTL